jgi:hypothetical protein
MEASLPDAIARFQHAAAYCEEAIERWRRELEFSEIGRRHPVLWQSCGCGQVLVEGSRIYTYWKEHHPFRCEATLLSQIGLKRKKDTLSLQTPAVRLVVHGRKQLASEKRVKR